jgi:hypothetical protein
MPKFDASSIGGKLEFDFSEWIDPKLGTIIGSVPEPPRAAVNRLMRNVTAAFKEMGIGDKAEGENLTPTEVADEMDKIEDEEVFEKMNEMLLDALTEVCGGTPSKDVLYALPYRPFMGFFGYLIGNLTNPEASAPATNSRPRLKSV